MHDFAKHLVLHPFILLFVTISLGYFVGKIRYKTFVLGGISGSLIMGVIIGQLGVNIPSEIGTIFFALFIYAVGYQGGAQFFKSLNKKTLLELVSATLTCVLGLLCVLFFAWFFHLDRGTAAGLAAGGLTQSAMIGSADSALMHLGLAADVVQKLQANIAVGYAICYIFGSFGPILLLATVFPLIMRWNLRKEAIDLAAEQAHGEIVLEPGQFDAADEIKTRFFKITAQSILLNKTLSEIVSQYDMRLAVQMIVRHGKQLDSSLSTKLEENDIVALSIYEDELIQLRNKLGDEVHKPANVNLIKEHRHCILSRKEMDGLTLAEFSYKLLAHGCYGFFIKKVFRFGESLPVNRSLKLKRGDEIEFIAVPKELDRISKLVGATVTLAPITDFIIFGIGIALGFVLGLISIPILGVSVPIGAGVGCLLSGLFFGWVRSVKPLYGALPTGASNFLRDFGLAVFVTTVGLRAGPQAITAIRHHGLDLFLLGVGVTIIPQIISFFFTYYVLRIKNPINVLSVIAGGRSANPGFAALLEKAGNATPVMPFTMSYTLANVWLTLWGPLIIALITRN